MDRRTYLTFAGSAAATVALAGCMGTQPDDDEGNGDGNGDGDGDGNGDEVDEEFAVTITQGQMADTLDPQAHNDSPTYNVVDHVYEGLIDTTSEGEMTELIATDWERVEDELLRFTIRDDVTFHSGNEMTIDDVVYSINRTVQEDVGIASPQASNLVGVEGAEASGDATVDVTLSGLNPATFANFSAFGRIMEQSWTEEREGNGESGDVALEMNGTGPFELEEHEEDVQTVFTRFDDYWGGPVEVDRVTFNAATESSTRVNSLLAGETDIIVNVPPQDVSAINDADDVDTEIVRSTRVIFLVMPNDSEPFDSQEFRQAMNYAVDVESIIDELLAGFGEPTGQPTLEGHLGHDPDVEPYPYDADRAAELVDESGYADAEIVLHSPVGRYLRDIDIAQAAAAQIDELPNVSCEVEQRDFGDLVAELIDGDMSTSPDFYLIGWGNPTFDANYTLLPWFMPGETFQHFEDDEVTELLEASEAEADEAEREAILQETNAVLNEKAPWVYLHNQFSIYGKSDRISWEARQDEDIRAYDMSPQ